MKPQTNSRSTQIIQGRHETKFQKQVFKIVKQIPRGKVMTYREAARESGHPKAWRAVGNILNKNQDLHPPKFSKKTLAGKQIPCHRIIRSDGRIGGYRYGTKRKIALLKKEGIKINYGKITSRFRK